MPGLGLDRTAADERMGAIAGLRQAFRPRPGFRAGIQQEQVAPSQHVAVVVIVQGLTVDGGDPVAVSCYAADEIPGWPLFERAWPDSGDHVVQVEVLGEPDPRSSGTRVWLDAISMEK